MSAVLAVMEVTKNIKRKRMEKIMLKISIMNKPLVITTHDLYDIFIFEQNIKFTIIEIYKY